MNEEIITLIKTDGFFEMVDEKEVKTLGDNCIFLVGDKEIKILIKNSKPLVLKLSEIDEIIPKDYKVYIKLRDGRKAVASKLGYEYENFIRIFIGARNVLMQEYLLMEEKLIKKDMKAQYQYFDYSGNLVSEGLCSFSVFETGLVILPDNYNVLRLPFSLVDKMIKAPYKFTVTLETGEKIDLLKMGYDYDGYTKSIVDAYDSLVLKTAEFFKSISAGTTSQKLNSLALLMLDGKPAAETEIGKIDLTFLKSLEQMIEEGGAGKEYNYLKNKSSAKEVYYGIKQGLMGELSQDYLWFLVPFYNNDKPGGAIAMEAFALPKTPEEPSGVLSPENSGIAVASEETENLKDEDTSGKATYFFKIFDEEKISMKKDEYLISKIIKDISRALIKINFRREPIYLSEEALLKKSDEKYSFAIKNISELKELRQRFAGRVFHSGFDKWAKNADEIILLEV